MAARKTPLTVVPPGAKSPRTRRPTPKSVASAVESGTQREQLVALRTRIAKAIDEPNIRGADLAALSRRVLEISREIDALDVAAKQEAAESGEVADEAFDSSAV